MEIKNCEHGILIFEGRILNRDNQRELIKWFWNNKPELVVCIISNSDDRLNRYTQLQAESEQRWFLNWISTYKPELLKEYADMVKDNESTHIEKNK